MQWSLKELLLLFAVVAVALPALMYANDWIVLLVVLFTAAVVGALLIRALLDRHARRAFAIGFLAIALPYAAFCLIGGGGNLDPYSNGMITSRIMQEPFSWISSRRSFYIDPYTNEKIFDFPPAGSGVGSGGIGGGDNRARYFEYPSRQAFMRITHCLWTLLLGYLGGKYALVVHARRERDAAAPL